jgi:iron complex outermembrane recepter protein
MPALVLVAAMGLAAGQVASTGDDRVDEIIVTGERARRSLKDTSSSVAVVTQSEIEETGANRVDQILALIPNVQLLNGSSGPIIRGQDTTGALSALPAFLGGNRPRSTIVVDGRPATYNEFIFGTSPVWDVKRIEVFRSPQTTTQGQNSIAGAIFVNTNDPTFTPEYRARAIIGDYKTRQVSAVASGPIAGDDVAFRVTGDFRYARPTSKIFDWVEGADPNHDVYGLLRAKLLITPSALPGTRATLTYAHTESKAPQVVAITAPFRNRRDVDGGYGTFRVNVDALTAEVQQEFAGGLSANFVLTGADRNIRRFAPTGLGQTRNNGRDWTGEAVVNWSPEGPLQIVGGVSHTHVYLDQFINLSRLSGVLGSFRDWQDGTGIFGEATVAIAPRLSLTAGLRYQRDRQERRGALGNDAFSVPVDFVGKFDAVLPKVTLAYDLTPSFRAGLMVQKAYNPGGTTIRFDTGRPDNFQAESLWDFELFTRTELADGRFTASTNLFYYDMHNSQQSIDILIPTPEGIPVGFASLLNIPKAHSYGFEGDLAYRATDSLTLRLAMGLLDSKITKTDAETADFQGHELAGSPHFSVSAALDWKPTKQVQLSAQVRHHGPFPSYPGASDANRVPASTIVDGRAEFDTGPVSLFVQVRNFFDALGLLQVVDEGRTAYAEDPMSVSIGIETRF